MNKKQFARNQGGSVELKEGTGGITKMCVIDNFIEIYKIDKTFTFYTPNSLDPEQTDPNMPHVITNIKDVGSANKIVARVFIQLYDVLKSSPLYRDINKKEIIILLHESKELLLFCENAFNEFETKYRDCINFITSSNLNRVGNIFTNFPSIDNLNSLVTSFLTNAKKFITNQVKIFNVFYHTEYNGARFDSIIKWLETNYKDETELIKFLKYGVF